VLYTGVRKYDTGEFGKLKHAFIDANAYEILVIGSSRAESHFHSGIIADSTRLSVYNIGMTGATMPFVQTALEAYLEKSKAPKFVILNIDYHVLMDPVDSIHHFPRYFPYIGENEALYNGISNQDPRFPYFRYLAPYSMPYFGSRYLNVALRGFAGKPGKYDSTYVNGWSPTEQALIPLDSCAYAPYLSEGPELIWESMTNIDAICKKKQAMLIVVLSPLYEKQSNAIINEKEIKDRISAFQTAANGIILDYSRDTLCTRQEYFADPAHLNKTGAMVFSRRFAHDLKTRGAIKRTNSR
jgi:hypothetical protein